MSERLNDFLQTFLDGQAAVARALVRVEYERHPSIPGLSKYTLYGQTRESVQGSIDGFVARTERHEGGGFAQFLTPSISSDGRWTSRGEVMLYPVESAA